MPVPGCMVGETVGVLVRVRVAVGVRVTDAVAVLVIVLVGTGVWHLPDAPAAKMSNTSAAVSARAKISTSSMSPAKKAPAIAPGIGWRRAIHNGEVLVTLPSRGVPLV